MDEENKRKLLSFKERMEIAQVMQGMARDNVIECETFTGLMDTVAKAIGKDEVTFKRASIDYIARELGIEIRVTTGMSLPNLTRRVAVLEGLCATLVSRVDELERVYIEEGKAAYVKPPKQTKTTV